MRKRIESLLYTINLTFLLTLNLFLIIAFVLLVVGVLVNAGYQLGIINWTDYLTPSAVAITVYAACILIGISMVVMIHFIILKPVHNMVVAMQRLASGDFATRMICEGWMHPLELREFAQAFNTAAQELGGTEL